LFIAETSMLALADRRTDDANHLSIALARRRPRPEDDSDDEPEYSGTIYPDDTVGRRDSVGVLTKVKLRKVTPLRER